MKQVKQKTLFLLVAIEYNADGSETQKVIETFDSSTLARRELLRITKIRHTNDYDGPMAYRIVKKQDLAQKVVKKKKK